MSDYLSRLIMRAKGSDTGPRVRPLPRVYTPEEQGPASPAIETEPRIQSASPPLMSGSAVEPPKPRRYDEIAEFAALPGRDKSDPPSSVPPAARTAAGARSRDAAKDQKSRPGAKDVVGAAIGISLPGRIDESSAPQPPEEPPSRSADHREPGPLPPRLLQAATGHKHIRSEQAVVRPDSRAAAGPQTLAGPSTVTIGRIDIVVAPPSEPARPRTDNRTRGFESYARLRRGIDR